MSKSSSWEKDDANPMSDYFCSLCFFFSSCFQHTRRVNLSDTFLPSCPPSTISFIVPLFLLPQLLIFVFLIFQGPPLSQRLGRIPAFFQRMRVRLFLLVPLGFPEVQFVFFFFFLNKNCSIESWLSAVMMGVVCSGLFAVFVKWSIMVDGVGRTSVLVNWSRSSIQR